MKNSIFTIPNMLSVLRLCLIPFITTTYSRGMELSATVLLVVSGITDLLDGFIARHMNQISDLGKILDPMADKLTTAAVVFALLLRHPQIWLVLTVLVMKESLMLVGSYFLIKKGARPAEAKLFGKLSTLYLYIALFFIMVSDVVETATSFVLLSPKAIWILSAIACVFMICAVVQYAKIYKGIVSEEFITSNTFTYFQEAGARKEKQEASANKVIKSNTQPMPYDVEIQKSDDDYHFVDTLAIIQDVAFKLEANPAPKLHWWNRFGIWLSKLWRK